MKRPDTQLSIAALGLVVAAVGAGLMFTPAAFLVVAGAGLIVYAVYLAPEEGPPS